MASSASANGTVCWPAAPPAAAGLHEAGAPLRERREPAAVNRHRRSAEGGPAVTGLTGEPRQLREIDVLELVRRELLAVQRDLESVARSGARRRRADDAAVDQLGRRHEQAARRGAVALGRAPPLGIGAVELGVEPVVAVVAFGGAPIGATGRLSVSDEFESHETKGIFDVRTGCDARRQVEEPLAAAERDAEIGPACRRRRLAGLGARYCGVELSAIVSRLGSSHAPE